MNKRYIRLPLKVRHKESGEVCPIVYCNQEGTWDREGDLLIFHADGKLSLFSSRTYLSFHAREWELIFDELEVISLSDWEGVAKDAG